MGIYSCTRQTRHSATQPQPRGTLTLPLNSLRTTVPYGSHPSPKPFLVLSTIHPLTSPRQRPARRNTEKHSPVDLSSSSQLRDRPRSVPPPPILLSTGLDLTYQAPPGLHPLAHLHQTKPQQDVVANCLSRNQPDWAAQNQIVLHGKQKASWARVPWHHRENQPTSTPYLTGYLPASY